jgi:hypothetical protein
MTQETTTYYEAWQAQNRKLAAEGWTLSTIYMVNGDVQHWADKGNLRIRVDPPTYDSPHTGN